MALPPRLFAGDEELGKKNDDHKPGKKSSLGIAWQQRRLSHGPLRRTVKRVALGALALIAVYYFFKNMPTDLENPRPRPHYDHRIQETKPGTGSKPPPSINQDSIPKPGHEETTTVSPHYFNGPIKFYQLATTLHAVSRTKGSELINRNVLFAAASLSSASVLLPIACEMAMRERNYVHFALMGRDDISMDILKSVNGITKECKIMFHDARPDFSVHSTDFRMEVSASAGFNHINTFVHPQATFIDGSGEEELFFLKGLKNRANSLGKTVIELPENSEQNLMWTTLLDSASLSAWNKVTIDLLIHAPLSSSGSLIRLLESLKRADFFSSAPPRLTIELPQKVDESTRRYLETFKWPPHPEPNSGSLLTLHHRIPQRGLTAEENSIRFLESFWPADPLSSHVLVVSPQMELSPLFFHYLKYTMLEYKYSENKLDGHENLFSISLDLPSAYLNDTTAFTPPLLNGTHELHVSPFLWQAPNSNAALYFGDKWVELHDFVARLLSSQHLLPTPATLYGKLVSKAYPSWLEHILKLARARGYWTLYPNFENADALATLHSDLYQTPEEYAGDPEMEAVDSASELTADPTEHLSLMHPEIPLATKSLISILPFGGDLPKIGDMPLLAWDGETTGIPEIGTSAMNYSEIFRHEIGGCAVSAMEKPRVDLSAGDLFCLNDGVD